MNKNTNKAQVRNEDIVSLPSFTSITEETPDNVEVHRPSDPQNHQQRRESDTGSKNQNHDNIFAGQTQSFDTAANLEDLKNSISDLDKRLNKTNKRLNFGRVCVIGCINLILVALLIIVFFMVKFQNTEEKEVVGPDQFEVLANLIDSKGDNTDHSELQANVMKQFKKVAGKLTKMKKDAKSNVSDIYKNSRKHSSNSAHLDMLNTNGKQRIDRLEVLMNKFQNRINLFVNGTDEKMFETHHFDELMQIFESKPTNFISDEMKSTYKKLGEFDLIGAIIDGHVMYNKTNEIKEIGTKYQGQVNEKGIKDGIGRNMNTDQNLLFEGEFTNSMREGYGRAIFKNGNVYEGYWRGWNLYGYGVASYYTGPFKGKKISGRFSKYDCVKDCVWDKV